MKETRNSFTIPKNWQLQSILKQVNFQKTSYGNLMKKQTKVKEELADVPVYSLLLAEKYGFDLKDILLNKIKKYPIEKRTAKKYTVFILQLINRSF